MRGKRTLALLLAVVLLLSGMLPASAEIGPAKTFSDVPANAWYQDSLNWLTMLGVVHGDGDGTFRPESTLTRGEFLSMLFNSLENGTMDYLDEETGQPGDYQTMKDIHWAQPYWNALNDMGIIAGSNIKCSRESLNGVITRNEMAVLITNTLY